jgi:hypothetical protein
VAGVQVNNKIVHAEEVVGALVEHCGGRSERISQLAAHYRAPLDAQATALRYASRLMTNREARRLITRHQHNFGAVHES